MDREITLTAEEVITIVLKHLNENDFKKPAEIKSAYWLGKLENRVPGPLVGAGLVLAVRTSEPSPQPVRVTTDPSTVCGRLDLSSGD